ncbi:hypothetical protein OQH60_07880 [Campylobacter sp. MIT 21-1685]|uniref:hypothetical protein n=1 Tax=unclassified Campylobacter TaxID=2593542 RepID=UPI00224AC764|nr:MULTISPECIES: hypothetical protein [unclassified Campylobacter]MCX2683787.1 hypothetical protein [Campylobacter sp. MIT 21-1684]MCX2752071.1 hypothetical protein [Campylobacter sp. MIT 21-1682]MCX2808256.1 hypothetical protein [Campylobacter sp. MIT 21-1685]
MRKVFYAILGIFAILIIVMIKGCYYPTSYRAFIPKALDSDYKEFQRLCKEEIGKVVYARPVGEGVKLEDMVYLDFEIPLGEFVSLILGSVKEVQHDYYYMYIAGFRYYTGWSGKTYIIVFDTTKQYIECEPLLYGKDWKEEYAIIKNIAFNNKEYIGKEYEEMIFNPNISWKTVIDKYYEKQQILKQRNSNDSHP